MKVLIVGANGQLGRALQRCAPLDAEVVAHDTNTLDITDKSRVDACVAKVRPELVLNAAAYTAVDRAESEEEQAYAVNATAVGYLAAAANDVGAKLVHVSTDFVFDGRSGVPYKPEAEPNPLGAYGRTKLAGEHLVGADALVVRTAWVYAPTGGNFVRTMLQLMAEKPEVRVVADQVGTPTYAPGLARALWSLAQLGLEGIYHYTDAGVTSWYDFAVAIQEEGLAAGLLAKPVPVIPICTADFPTAATRPSYSVLEMSSTFAALGRPNPHWRDNLRVMIKDVATYG